MSQPARGGRSDARSNPAPGNRHVRVPGTGTCLAWTGACSDRGSLELAAAVLLLEPLREVGEVAVEHLLEAVLGQLDPVVGDAALGVVVGADLLRPLARSDLGLAGRGVLG